MFNDAYLELANEVLTTGSETEKLLASRLIEMANEIKRLRDEVNAKAQDDAIF